MKRTQTIAHLEMALLELAYAKADARHRMLSEDAGANAESWPKLIAKLDAVSQAVKLAISILEAPAVAKFGLEAA